MLYIPPYFADFTTTFAIHLDPLRCFQLVASDGACDLILCILFHAIPVSLGEGRFFHGPFFLSVEAADDV